MIVRPSFVASEKIATTVPRASRQVKKTDLCRRYTSICAANGVEPLSVCHLKLQAAPGKWSTDTSSDSVVVQSQFLRKKSNPWHLPRAKDSWICWLCVLLKSDTFVPWCPSHILQSRVLFRPSRGNFNTLNAMQMRRVPLWKQRGAFGELLQNSLSSLSFLKFDHKSLNPRHSARCHARREIYLCRLCRERNKRRFAASS